LKINNPLFDIKLTLCDNLKKTFLKDFYTLIKSKIF